MLGLSSISELPISSSIFDPNVSINVTGNPLTLSIGAATTLAGALVNVTGNSLTAATGSVVINAAANVTVAGSGTHVIFGTEVYSHFSGFKISS